MFIDLVYPNNYYTILHSYRTEYLYIPFYLDLPYTLSGHVKCGLGLHTPPVSRASAPRLSFLLILGNDRWSLWEPETDCLYEPAIFADVCARLVTG